MTPQFHKRHIAAMHMRYDALCVTPINVIPSHFHTVYNDRVVGVSCKVDTWRFSLSDSRLPSVVSFPPVRSGLAIVHIFLNYSSWRNVRRRRIEACAAGSQRNNSVSGFPIPRPWIWLSFVPFMPRQLAQRFLSGGSAFMLWSGIPRLCQRHQQPGRTIRLDGLIHVEHVGSLRKRPG